MTGRYADDDVVAQAEQVIADVEARHHHTRSRPRNRSRAVWAAHHPLTRAVLDRQPFAIATAILTLTLIGVAIAGLLALTVGP